MRHELLRASVFAVSLLAAACGGGAPTAPTTRALPEPAPVLTDLRISGGAGLAVGGRIQLKATSVFSDASTRDVTSEVIWQSLSLDVAIVSATGLVSGLAPGSARVQASWQRRLAERMVPVTADAPSAPCD